MVDYVAMGRRLKMKRRSKKLSQEQLAKAVNISPSFYGNIERGLRIPSIDTLVALANVLGVGTDFLLADSVYAAVPQHTPEEMRVLYRYLRDRVAELDYGEETDPEEFLSDYD
jgi:transcriptional regulator with XRE-family HTH domain